jgi:hypothetical protein
MLASIHLFLHHSSQTAATGEQVSLSISNGLLLNSAIGTGTSATMYFDAAAALNRISLTYRAAPNAAQAATFGLSTLWQHSELQSAQPHSQREHVF